MLASNVTAQDLWASVYRYQIWFLLAWQDLKIRYRRSIIGPFWLTISMAVTVYSMGFLYGKLFKIDLATYYPYLTVGMITWQFISVIVNEASLGFLTAEPFLKEIKLPPPVFIMRLICRNTLILLHNLPVYLPIMVIFHIWPNLNFLWVLPGLILLLINGFTYGTLMAMFGARFRDVGQIITSVVQVIFFVTPIMWSTSILPAAYLPWVKMNPFAVFVDLIRTPLLGLPPQSYDYLFAGTTALVGIILLLLIYPRYRSRLIYWL